MLHHWLAGAAGDHALAADGDLAEDGQGVTGQQVQLRVPELGVGHELGEASVITGKILLKSVFTSGEFPILCLEFKNKQIMSTF